MESTPRSIENAPTLDLVLATVSRTAEPARFLRALDAQVYTNLRVIVADQNTDNRLVPILAEFEDRFPILHVRAEPGLSRARNAALSHVAADLVAFPDDDSWYSPNTLQLVVAFLGAHAEWDGISGRVVDEAGSPAAGRTDTNSGAMTVYNLWKRATSGGLFVRRRFVEVVGAFDETLGLGAGTPWGGGEDFDYVVRGLRAGYSVYYDPTVVVRHPLTRERSSDPDVRHGYRHGAGFGRVLRKNQLPWWFAAYSCARSFGASGLSLLTGKPGLARFYWAVGKGRVRGWRSASSSS